MGWNIPPEAAHISVAILRLVYSPLMCHQLCVHAKVCMTSFICCHHKQITEKVSPYLQETFYGGVCHVHLMQVSVVHLFIMSLRSVANKNPSDG